jgi:hypothetical protein
VSQRNHARAIARRSFIGKVGEYKKTPESIRRFLAQKGRAVSTRCSKSKRLKLVLCQEYDAVLNPLQTSYLHLSDQNSLPRRTQLGTVAEVQLQCERFLMSSSAPLLCAWFA